MQFGLNLFLAFVWAFLHTSFTAGTFIAGFIIGAGITICVWSAISSKTEDTCRQSLNSPLKITDLPLIWVSNAFLLASVLEHLMAFIICKITSSNECQSSLYNITLLLSPMLTSSSSRISMPGFSLLGISISKI